MGKEIVHTNEKLQIAEEIPKTTHDSTIVSIPSDQKEVEELPIITVTHDKAYVAEEIPVTTLDSSIQSLPSDQKEAEGLPTIIYDHSTARKTQERGKRTHLCSKCCTKRKRRDKGL